MTSIHTSDQARVGIAVFVWRNGKFIMQQRIGSHGANTWSVPGGHLEFGESWEDCARREVMEEVGVEIQNIRFFAATNDIFPEHNKHYISIWLEADWLANEPSIQEADRLTDIRWCDFKTQPSPLFEPCWTNLRSLRPELFK
jgi:8-oxo-dGTP diphosphatase